MHHDLPSILNLLESVESEVIEVIGRVQIPLLVSHDLLEKIVPTCFSLLPLEE